MSAAPLIKPILKFEIEILKGPHAGEKFSFSDQVSVSIGRGSENDICLSMDPHSSRLHAEIKQLDGNFYVSNLSSKNFILINGDRVDVDRIDHNGVVTVGDSELKLNIDSSKTLLSGDATVAIPQPNGQLPVVAPMPPPMAPLTTAPVVRPSVQTLNAQSTGVAQVSANAPKPMMTSQNGAVHSAATYTPPKMNSNPQPRIQGASYQDNSRLRFYGIIAVIGVLLFWFFSGSKAKKEELNFRGSVEVQGDLEESKKTIAKLDERLEKMKEPSAVRAQENYIRGFREYRQGNYLRAMDHFQIVLSLDPGNELADRYRKLAITKQDELVKFNMIQGRKYREKRNFRLCKSSFLNALVLIQYNKQHPDYLEADRFLDECDKALKGRM